MEGVGMIWRRVVAGGVLLVFFIFFGINTVYAQVVINEVAWMGTASSSADEWIELYNTSSSDISLEGWKIVFDEGGSTSTLLSFEECSNLSITGESFYLLERTNDTTVGDISADCIYTGALGNGGESLVLRSTDGNTMNTANGSGSDWPAGINPTIEPENWGTMERINPEAEDIDINWSTNDRSKINGKDVGGNPIYGTPGAKNSVYETEVSSNDTKKEIDFTFSPLKPQVDEQVFFEATSSKAGQYLWSFGEDIEATSSGPTTTYSFATGGNYLVTLKLEGEGLVTTSTVSVSKAESDSDRSDTTTDEEAGDQTGLQEESENLSSANQAPACDAGQNKIVNVGAKVSFDASGAFDPEGDKLEYFWNFGDGATAEKETTEYSFDFPGEYLVSLRVSDGKDSCSDQVQVWVYPARIYISEFMPNPEGKDSEGEWIEIGNREDFVVDLSGFGLDDTSGGSAEFVIPEDTFLGPGTNLVFKRDVTGLSLNNDGDKVRLLYPSEDVLDSVSYDKAKEGKSAARKSEKFLWTEYSTPGQDNVIVNSDASESPQKEALETKEDSTLTKADKQKTEKEVAEDNQMFAADLDGRKLHKARVPTLGEVDFKTKKAHAQEEFSDFETKDKKTNGLKRADLTKLPLGKGEIYLLLSVLISSVLLSISVVSRIKKGRSV